MLLEDNMPVNPKLTQSEKVTLQALSPSIEVMVLSRREFSIAGSKKYKSKIKHDSVATD